MRMMASLRLFLVKLNTGMVKENPIWAYDFCTRIFAADHRPSSRCEKRLTGKLTHALSFGAIVLNLNFVYSLFVLEAHSSFEAQA